MNLIKIFTFILISLNISIKANSIEIAEGLLKKGGNLILIRHAYAPGNGDPGDFILSDCSTQRNLNDEGIQESKDIGSKNKYNFYTGTFDVIDKAGDDKTSLFGIQHKNEDLYRNTLLGKFSPLTGAFMTALYKISYKTNSIKLVNCNFFCKQDS